MNPLQLQIWARQVADDYVVGGVDPNISITKIAEDNDLSRIYIQRIVEAANTDTYDKLRRMSADKTFTFPMADMEKISTKLSGLQKKASASLSDITLSLNNYNQKKASGLLKEAASACGQDSVKKEFNNKKVKGALKKIAAHTKMMHKVAQEELHAACRTLGAELDALTFLCKQAVFSGQTKLSEIEKVAHQVEEDPQLWSVVIEEVKNNLEKLGEPFTGLLASDKELLKDRDRGPQSPCPGMPVMVINGRNPIVKQLKQVSAAMRGVSRKDILLHDIDSMYSHVVMSEQQFPDTAEVEDYIANKMQKIAMDLGQTPEDLIKNAGVPLLGTAVRFGVKAAKGAAKGAVGLVKRAPVTTASVGLGAVQAALSKSRSQTSLVPGLPPHRAVDGGQRVER